MTSQGVVVNRSRYLDTKQYTPEVVLTGCSDIVTMRYPAASFSNSSINFRINSSGPRSLLDSEALLVVDLEIHAKSTTAGANMTLGAPANVYTDGRSMTGAVGDHNTAQTLARSVGNRPAGGVNYGFAEKHSSFWNAVSSVVCEINNSVSISKRPQDFMGVCEHILCRVQDEDSWPQGPRDSGSNGHFVGRAFKVEALNGGEIRVKDFEVDEGFAKRVGLFREQYRTAAYAAHTVRYKLVTRIPVEPFTYWRKGIGSSARTMLPYCNTISLQINMVPDGPERMSRMFQCTAVQGNQYTGNYTIACVVSNASSAIAAGTYGVLAPSEVSAAQSVNQVPGHHANNSVKITGASMVLKWLAPQAEYKLAPIYSFSVPRWLCYKKDWAVDAEFNTETGGHPVVWSTLKVESMPKFIAIWVQPKWSVPAAGSVLYEKFRTGFFDCSYQGTYDRLKGDESSAASLTIQINERASLLSTFTLRDLYEITRKNCPAYKYDFDTWKRGDRQVIVLSADDIPSVHVEGEYYPQTITVSGTWVANRKHVPTNGIAEAPVAGSFVPGTRTEAVLAFIYEDSLSLSSSSASQQSFLVSKAQLQGSAPQQKPAALDDMAY